MAKTQEELSNLEKIKLELAQLKNKVHGYEQKFENKVQDNPLASVGIAFGAGVLAGAVVALLAARK